MNLNEQQYHRIKYCITNFELYNEMNWINFDTLIIRLGKTKILNTIFSIGFYVFYNVLTHRIPVK